MALTAAELERAKVRQMKTGDNPKVRSSKAVRVIVTNYESTKKGEG